MPPTIDQMGGLLADGTGDSIVNERGMNGSGKEKERRERSHRARLIRQRARTNQDERWTHLAWPRPSYCFNRLIRTATAY